MNSDFKKEVEQFVLKARGETKNYLKEGGDTGHICLSCWNYVNFYFATIYHHPEICERCINVLYIKWEKRSALKPFPF